MQVVLVKPLNCDCKVRCAAAYKNLLGFTLMLRMRDPADWKVYATSFALLPRLPACKSTLMV